MFSLGETTTGGGRRKLPRIGRGPNRKNSDTFRNRFNAEDAAKSGGSSGSCSEEEIRRLQRSNEKEIKRIEAELETRKKTISELEDKLLHQKEEHSSVHSDMKGEVGILEERLQSRKDEITRLEETLRKEREENRALSVDKLSQVALDKSRLAINFI